MNNLIDLATSKPLLSLSLISFILLSYILNRIGRREKDLPPGPPTLPIIGNLHQIPLSQPYIKFTEWSKEFGEIYSLKLGPSTMIVLNDAKSVKDLLDGKSGVYSDRAPHWVGRHLITNNNNMLMLEYGKHWQTVRKIIHGCLGVRSVDRHVPLQEAEGCEMVAQIAENPKNWHPAIRRYSMGVSIATAYGKRTPKWDTPEVTHIYEVMDNWVAIIEPGATPPVDIFPFLKYIPTSLAPWKQRALKCRKDMLTLYYGLMNELKSRMEKGQRTGCFLEDVVDNQKTWGLTDEQLVFLGGNFLEGGSDTTASAAISFVLAMVKHPEIFKKAQAEIDKVVGNDRFPVLTDRESCPYLNACLTEVARWRPVAATGVPHSNTQEDFYRGYRFPKGSTIIFNVWALHRDESVYGPNTEDFIPERFLERDISTDSTGRQPTWSFGVGRRICQGIYLANNSNFLIAARLLWTFNIYAPNGPQSVDVSPKAFTKGLLTGPLPFDCTFEIRSPARLKVLEEERKVAHSEIFSKYYESELKFT